MLSFVRAAGGKRSVVWGVVLVLLSTLCFSGMAFAADDDDEQRVLVPRFPAAKNFYGGLGLGLVTNDTPDAWQDGSLTEIDDDKSDTSLSFVFGYQINEYFAVQGAYRDLGESGLDAISDGEGDSWSEGEVGGVQEADGWELGILGRWPISQRWYALGIIGIYSWKNTETFWENDFRSSISESGTSMTYALGFEYDVGLKNRFTYRFMGSHHAVGDDDYDVNGASATLIYRFP